MVEKIEIREILPDSDVIGVQSEGDIFIKNNILPPPENLPVP